MHRRALTLVLTLVFALQATWLLHAGVDALAPAAAAVSAPSDCCPRACGCPEEVRLRKGCCCSSGAEAQVPAGSRAFEAQRCRGVEAAMLQALTQPALETFPRLRFVPSAGTLRLVCVLPEPSVESSPPDKIPIL